MPNNKLTMQDKVEIVQLAATTKMTNKQLAERFGVSNVRIGQILRDNAPITSDAQQQAMMLALSTVTADLAYDQQWRMKDRMRDLLKLDAMFTPDAINAREK